MEIIDISVPISPQMITWPGDPAVAVEPSRRISRGDAANVSQLTMGSHTGTHVDPPFHFVDEGPRVDAIALDALYGKAQVLDLGGVEDQISVADLQGAGLEDGIERVLFKTRNCAIWEGPAEFPASYVSLSVEGAQWLRSRAVRLVGIDFLSIEKRKTPGHPTHKALLTAGIVIIEGLDLRKAEPGVYTFCCLPLKIAGGDGAPARAILIR